MISFAQNMPASISHSILMSVGLTFLLVSCLFVFATSVQTVEIQHIDNQDTVAPLADVIETIPTVVAATSALRTPADNSKLLAHDGSANVSDIRYGGAVTTTLCTVTTTVQKDDNTRLKSNLPTGFLIVLPSIGKTITAIQLEFKCHG